jgi:hypothetical protein
MAPRYAWGAVVGLILLWSTAPLRAAILSMPPDHVVIVIEENHSYTQITSTYASSAPNILALAASGAVFTNSHATAHPSQPNYLELFSGSSQGTTSDTIPSNTPFTAANLGAQLIAVAKTFFGYSEDLPSVGSLVSTSGNYARKHNPWSDWQANSPGANQLPASTNQPLSAFPTDFTQLPTVSFVVPNQNDDMHNGTDPSTIATGDTWFQNHLGAYSSWAQSHNSLLIVTFDEDNTSNLNPNQILTIFSGPMIQPGHYSEFVNHDNILRTLEDLYDLPYAGSAATAAPITDAFFTPVPEPGMLWLVGVAFLLGRRRCGRPSRIGTRAGCKSRRRTRTTGTTTNGGARISI